MKKELLREYKFSDSEQKMFTSHYLRRFVAAPRKESELKDYYRVFDMIAHDLVAKRKLGTIERVEMFL